ncbi:MAG: ATP-dependent DNA helicase RecQ [Gemmatimonadetes bacterium]|nr:ATP-dependent DNA helicase RecQ [Gemmatimonadota bacterium]
MDHAPGFDRALAVLATHFGYQAFRPPQERVVRSILSGKDTLAILPTGAGKSICFQVPAIVLGGLTVVVSPLLALMQDQVAGARARGIPARALNSLLTEAASRQVMAEAVSGELRLLYLAPERCPRLVRDFQERRIKPSLLAVDEAHCIAEWGPDFRPAYLGLGQFRRAVGGPPTVALTGSATPAVRSTIARVLGLGATGGYALQVASFDRRNLSFAVVTVKSEPERLERLVSLVARDDAMAIVYAPTRNIVEGLTRELARRGLRAAPYHAGLAKAERGTVLADFLADRLDVVVATCAFGMGIDKPNVRLVVHWNLPATPEAYYQEAGRAGRDGAPARCVLLHRPGDGAIARRELEVTFPDRALVERAWADPKALDRLPRGVIASVERLKRELRPERGRARWDRVHQRRVAALERLATMERYASRHHCRRATLLEYFGERIPRCAGCDVCGEPVHRGAWPPQAVVRLRELRRVAAQWAGPWGSPWLEPATLARLALAPPEDLEALAATPGVGPELAHRIGASLLGALGGLGRAPHHPVALADWRREVAKATGRPAATVASLQTLASVAKAGPTTLAELSRIPGAGSRFVAKFGAALLEAVARQPPG